MAVLANRVRVTTSTTGTGTITLGSAATTYQTFAAAGIVNGDVVRYLIEEGTNWEIGTGTYTASGTTLSRTVSESSNGGSAITLAGNATVSIVSAAEDVTSDVEITGGTIDGAVIGGTTTAAANFTNVTLSGDLTVNGTTTTINTTNTVVSDNLIELNNGATSNANDSGIVIERGSTGDNAFMGWDESADSFIVGTTTATGSSTGDLTITAAALSAGSLTLTTDLAVAHGGTGASDPATARTNLGVDAAGTDNSTNVTLAGSLDYLTLSGQQITLNSVDLTTDVTGALPIANGGTNATTVSAAQTNLQVDPAGTAVALAIALG